MNMRQITWLKTTDELAKIRAKAHGLRLDEYLAKLVELERQGQKKQRVSIRLPRGAWAKAKEIARKKGITVSALCNMLIMAEGDKVRRRSNTDDVLARARAMRPGHPSLS